MGQPGVDALEKAGFIRRTGHEDERFNDKVGLLSAEHQFHAIRAVQVRDIAAERHAVERRSPVIAGAKARTQQEQQQAEPSTVL
jgi:ribosomal protein S12